MSDVIIARRYLRLTARFRASCLREGRNSYGGPYRGT